MTEEDRRVGCGRLLGWVTAQGRTEDAPKATLVIWGNSDSRALVGRFGRFGFGWEATKDGRSKRGGFAFFTLPLFLLEK